MVGPIGYRTVRPRDPMPIDAALPQLLTALGTPGAAGRYPKHSWPEDPVTAEAIRGVRRRSE